MVAPLDKSNKERRIYSLNRWLDFNGDGKISKGELALVAFTTGRFQTVASRPGKSLNRNSVDAPDRKSETRRTRSIYVRPLNGKK